MNSTAYTPEVMAQTGRIYDRLEQMPPDKRVFAKAIAEAFINGMQAQELLTAQASGQNSA